MTSTIRILLVDDQAMVRSGLALILGAEPDMRVVGELGNGADIVRAVVETAPDVVLMDVRMPGVDGPTATEHLRSHPGAPPVLALTTFEDDGVLWSAISAGAAGFLLKDSPADVLVEAVRVVADGGAWLDQRVLPRVLAKAREHSATVPAAVRAVESLTPREREVLGWIAQGATNAEIASHLLLGERTVKSHISAILSKMAVRDRSAAIVLAHDAGLRSAPPKG